MALKFLKSDEAAAKLGISADELNQLRERHEVSGYRDGPNWKFKESDIDRLAEDLAARKADAVSGGLDSEDFDLPIEGDGDSGEVVLVTDEELGESEPGTSSTIIGRPGEQRPEDSDIRLITPDASAEADASASGVKLVADTDTSPRDSDVKLAAEDVAFATGANVAADGPSDSNVGLGTDDSSGEPADAGSDITLGDEGLEISLDDELSLGDDDLVVAADADSESALSADEEDQEFVLGGSGSGSDITLSSADSGISLADPADSGLSLEQPLELGSADDASLELDLDGGAEPFSIDDDADSAEVVELSSQDDFELTPVEEASSDDEGSSGSQVIEIDDETPFGEEDLLGAGAATGALEEAGARPAPQVGFEAAAAPAMGVEPAYTTLNVISLSFCALLLGLCGTMAFDLVRNMWLWDGPASPNSAVMDLVLSLF